MFAALGPGRSLDVPIPVLAGETRLELTVRDLVLGCAAAQPVAPAAESAMAARTGADFVGGAEPVAAFLSRRKGPVTVLLDEGQDAFRPAAERLAALLRKNGREASVVAWDPSEVRPLPLRWKPTQEDLPILDRLRDGKAFAWRVGLDAIQKADAKGNRRILFDDPRCGYDEYGPRLRHDADIVLFGTPADNRALTDLQPWLRRLPTDAYPAPGGFFVHYLWSPFQGGLDGLYLACRDADGAAAAVAGLAGAASKDAEHLAATAPAGKPVITRGGEAAPLENMLVGKLGTRILDVAFAPSGKRIFVTADSYGDSFFALSPTGEIQEKRSLANRCGNSLWARSGGRLRPVDDATVRVSVGSSEYRYSLDHGWVSKAAIPPTGFTGRFTVPIAAPTLLEDGARQRAYLGGAARTRALDRQGRLVWSYDDAAVRTSTDDLLYPRSLFPRGVTTDGRVLLVAGFGIQHDCYGRGQTANASILGLDTANGKLLWQRDGMLLNQGKALPIADRFLVTDDSGAMRIIRAADGKEAGRLRPIGVADWVLPVPGRDDLLVVANNCFDRQGPTSRV
jgi:hypothetical protein